MNPPSAELARLLADAAEHKARGASWEGVAAHVGRHPDTCRRWPARYPELWQRLFLEAETRLVADAGGEAICTLRKMLRSNDEKSQQTAARVLVNLRQRQREHSKLAQTTDSSEWPDLGEGLNDGEELQGVVDEP